MFLVTDDQNYYYDISKPDEKHFLPYVLEEISGLSYKGNNRVVAVDDESGKLFEYDLSERKIKHSIEFYKGADFEGIEIVEDKVYILKSDGDIFYFDYTESKTTRGEKIETALGSKNDTEGLGYDPMTNKLLIACKERGGLDGEKLGGRGFYTFDIEKMELESQVAFVIGPKELEKFWESKKDFDYDQDRIKFKPSAIAFHPISHNYYILSSVGKMVLVVSNEGALQASYPISPGVLGQPEGICFAPNGDMLISSEGEGDRGYILKFKMKSRS